MKTKNFFAIHSDIFTIPPGHPAHDINYTDPQGNITNLHNTSSITTSNGNYGARIYGAIDTTDYMDRCSPQASSNIYTYINLVCGKGDTAATADDYALETPATELVRGGGSIMPIFDENDDPVGVSYNKTWINNTSDPVVIKETGVIVNVGTSGTSVATSALIDRTVLDTPVTVPANGSITVTYKMYW